MTSITLQRYLTARFIDGLSAEDAAFEADISIGEAKLTDESVERGELAVPTPVTDEPKPDLPPVLPLSVARAHLKMSEEPAPRARRVLDAITPPADAGISSTPEEKTMGRKAKSDNDNVEEIQQPDFERAAKILVGDIKPAEEKNAKARGDLSAAWKVIADECHVNKKAAKDVFKLRNMSEELRDDYLRSFYGMMQQFHLGISADLVDQMGDGEAPTMPVTDKPATETSDLAALQAAE
jgi:hypothetical protein